MRLCSPCGACCGVSGARGAGGARAMVGALTPPDSESLSGSLTPPAAPRRVSGVRGEASPLVCTRSGRLEWLPVDHALPCRKTSPEQSDTAQAIRRCFSHTFSCHIRRICGAHLCHAAIHLFADMERELR